MTDATVRPARPDDVPAIDRLVRALAVYEEEPDSVEATAEDFSTALFGPDPRVHCHVAEVTSADGTSEVVGLALWFVTFSTWRGRHGIWLEDLFVDPAHRGAGLGRRLMAALAVECSARGWTRLEWTVLDRNSPAHAFYRSVGAAPQDAWTTWRLDSQGLLDLSRT